MKGFLIDTNVVSEATTPEPSPAVTQWLEDTAQDLLFLSALTIGEIEFGIHRLPSGRRRLALEKWLDRNVLPTFGQRILPIDARVARTWGRLSAHAVENGSRSSAVDELLAATAVAHDLSLATRNVHDFVLYGVHVTNPWSYGIKGSA